MEYLKKIENIIKTPLSGKGEQLMGLGIILDNPVIALSDYKVRLSDKGLKLKDSTLEANYKLDTLSVQPTISRLAKEGLLGHISEFLKAIVVTPFVGKGMQSIAVDILLDNPDISLETFAKSFREICLGRGLSPAEATIRTYHNDLQFRVQQGLARYAVLPVAIALPAPEMATVAVAEALPLPVKVAGKGKGRGSKTK